MSKKNQLELTRDEALVLDDWLARWAQAGCPGADETEQRVLERIAGQLEEQLAETFLPDYKQILAAGLGGAREEDE